MSLHLCSHAKVNLFLKIISKRPNEYHNLQSFFVLLDLSDTITITSNDESIVEMNVDVSGENIITKALNLLSSHFKINTKYRVVVQKNIPISAGLGGGSSNAATVIRAICEHHNINITQGDYNIISTEIGADVPFFITNSNGLVEGIGEKITPYELGVKVPILLVNPGMQISTPLVYKNLMGEFSPEKSYSHEDLIAECHEANNDLSQAVLRCYPEIQNTISSLKSLEAYNSVGISGSGATCFTTFDTNEELQQAFDTISRKHPKWWIYQEELSI